MGISDMYDHEQRNRELLARKMKRLELLEKRVKKAVAMLQENIDTVPPHGCQRDEVLAVLKGEA